MAEIIDYNALSADLSSRRFLPEVYDTAEEAKEAVLRIIGGKSVGIGGSATVRDMKLAEALQANGNEVAWHRLVPKEAKKAEKAERAAAAKKARLEKRAKANRKSSDSAPEDDND